MANRKSNNGIIIDVGFRDDIESFIDSVESALEDVNFDESIGLSKAFDEQVKKVKAQLEDIKKEFRTTMGELNTDNITVAMQTLTKDMSALKKIVKEVVTKVPGADGLAKQLDEISQEVQSVADNAANAQKALNSMSTQKLTKEQRQYKADLKETYKLLQDIVKASEETATPKRQSGRSAYKSIESVLTDIEGAYQALQDAESKYYEALDTNAPERMLDNAQRNYALAISTFARLAATFDNVASKTNSSQRTATQLLGVDGATIQQLTDSYLGELDSFYEEAQGRIAKVSKEYADAGFGELITQRSKKSVKEAQEDIKGQELVVPLNVSTMPDDLSQQALEIIHQAQEKITEPLTVKVVFVSEYKSKKNQEILEGMKEQIKHIDDAGIKEKFTTLTDNLEKQIKGSLSFEVDVRTEHATQQVKAFKKQIKEELQELSDFIAPVTPKVELTDEHAAAFESQLSAAIKEVFAEVDNIKIPGMTNTDEILVALGSIFKQIMMIEVRANAIVQLLQKQPESTINKYADALGTFANIVNEITKTKDALKVAIKPIVQNAEEVKEDIGEQLTGIDVPITVSIQSNNIEEQVELLKNKINEEILALNDQLNALQPNVELSDDSKAKFQQELIEATNQIFADLHVFTDSLDELKTGVSDMFTPVTEDLQKTMGYIWEQVNLIEVRVKHIMDMIEENSHNTVSGEIWKMVNLIEVRVKRIMDLLEGFFNSDIFNVQITPVVADTEQAKTNIIEQLKDIDIPVNIVVSKDSAEKAKTAIADALTGLMSNASKKSQYSIGDIFALMMAGDEMTRNAGYSTQEWNVVFNTKTGQMSNPWYHGAKDRASGVSRDVVNLIQANAWLHSHPNGIAVPSGFDRSTREGDIWAWLTSGIDTGIILGRDNAFVFDIKQYFEQYGDLLNQYLDQDGKEKFQKKFEEVQQGIVDGALKNAILRYNKSAVAAATKSASQYSESGLQGIERVLSQINFAQWNTDEESIESFITKQLISDNEVFLSATNLSRLIGTSPGALLNSAAEDVHAALEKMAHRGLKRSREFSLDEFKIANSKLFGIEDVEKFYETLSIPELIDKYNVPVDIINRINSGAQNTDVMLNANEEQGQTISYLENTAKAIEAINKLLNKLGGKNGDTTIQKTVEGLNQIREALSSPITENSMMDALRELAAQGENLESLATVLKATKKDLLNAQQILGSANDQNIDDLMTNRAQEIRNRAVEEMLTLGGAGSKYVNVSNLSKTKDGLIEIVGLIQNADGNMQEFTLHTQDGVHMQNVAMSENTAKIAKQMKIYAQVDEYFKRMQNANKDAIENGGIIDIERDSELWKMLLDFIQEYGIELENVQKIVAKTRQTSGGELLLESFTASDKENSVTFGRAQNVVASSQNLLDPEQLATDFKKAQKTLQEYTELSYKVANNTATEEERQRLDQINSSYLDLYDRLEKINDALGTTSTVAQEARSEFENMQHLTMEQYFQSAIDKGEKAIQKIRDKYAKVAPEGSIDATKYTESDQQIINNIVESNRQLRELIEQINQGQIDYNTGLQQARVLTEQINANITQSGHKYASESQLQKLSSRVAGTINDNSAMSTGLQRRFQSLYSTLQYLQQMQKEGRQVDALTFDRLRNEFQALDSEMKHTGQTGNSLLSSIRKAITSQTATFVASVLSIRDFINYAQRLFSTIQTLDYELVDLRKTAHMTTEEFDNFYYESNQVAKEMGVSTANIISQAAAWSRLGYNTKEAAGEMARLSSQFASISPGMTTEEAQTGLVSIMKAWDVDVAQVERDIMDNINTLGNNFAETNLDIINGMERAGATFAAIGMNIQDSFALFTGAQEVVQNAETVGVALKTLSLRIRGYDEETEELSDDVVEATGKVADLTKVASNNFAGVSLWADAEQTTYRSLVDYLGDISKIWDEIGAKEKTELLESLFGKRGASVGSAILGNFDQVEKALTEMENAAGSADREMGIVQESLSYKLNALQQTWVGVAQKIAQRDTLGKTLDNLTKISEALGDIISKKGGLVTIAATLTGFIGGIRGFGLEHIIEIPKQIGIAMRYISAGTQKGGNIFDTLNNFLHNRNSVALERVKDIFRASREGKSQGIEAYNEFFASLNQEDDPTGNFIQSLQGDDTVEEFVDKIREGSVSLEDLEAAEQGAAAASNLLSGALTAIGFAIATYLITEAINYMDNVAEAAQKATDSLNENTEQLNEYISSIQSLRAQLDDSNTTAAQTVEYNKQLREIQRELIELYGDSAAKIDIFNGSLEEQGEIIQQLNGLSTNDVAQQRWINEVNNPNIIDYLKRMEISIGGAKVKLPHGDETRLEMISRKYEEFSKKISATSNQTLNDIIASYDNIELKNGKFIISGNVEDVQDVIIDIQTRLKSYAGYTEEFDEALRGVYNSAGKVASKYGDTYNQGLAFAIANNDVASDYQEQLNAAFVAFDNAATDEEKRIAEDNITNIVQAIQDSDLNQAIKNYLIKQTDSYTSAIAQLTLSSWKKAIDFVSERGSAKPLYTMFFGEDTEDVLSTPGFDLVDKLANGAYISADVQNMSEEFRILADTLRLDVEQLLELLRLFGLLDNKESVVASLTAPGQRTAQKNYVAKQILGTEDGLEIYNKFIAAGYGKYLEGEGSAANLKFVKQFFENERAAITDELNKTKKTIDEWFEKNNDSIDDYQKNLDSISEAISGYYNGTLTPENMIDLYQEFPEIIESADDLGTALKKLRIKQIEKLYDELGEDVPDKLRLELQRLEDQANQTAEILNNFSFENSAQSLKDGVEMIQSLNAGFEDGERGFDTIFSDDFINVFGKYKKEYSALIKTIETKGFKTNKKLQEQARQQANALGNAWIKDNLGLLNEEQLNAAKAIFEEMGVQIEGVAMAIQTIEEAQQAAADAGLDWNNITANSIQQLLTEGVVTAQTAREIIYYKMQELAAGNASIDTSTSIENLLMLQATLQSVGISLSGFQNMIARINSLKTMRANGLTRDKITGEDYYDQWVKEAIDGWVNKPVEITIPDVPDFGTGKDKDKGGGSDDKEKETEEVVDWIEKLIDRLERKLEHLEKVAGSTYETWETRANSLVEALEVTKQEIDAQRAAYDRYMAEANAVGLDEGYAQKIRDGAIDIETITDEELKNKIDKYDEYYTKALDAEEKIYDLTLHLSELAQQQFELIQTKFEKMITAIETSIQHIQNEIDDIFQKTLSTSYDEMIAAHRDEISQLEAEYNELTQSLAESVNAGYITEGTEAWYDMKNAIDEVSNSLQEQRNQIHELIKEQFDLIDSLYSGILEGTSLAYDKIDAAVDHLSTLGFVEAAGLYRRQLTEQVANLKQYYDEVEEQQKAFDQAVAEGMEEGSEAWVDMTSAINDTWNNIISTTAAIDDLRVALWELDWSKFEHGQAMIRNVIDEANFLVSMFKEDSLIDDYGFFTDNGVAVEGLHMQNFQTYKSQAQDYLDQIKAIEEMMNGDYVTNPEMLIQLIDSWVRDVYDVDTSDWKYEDYLSYADLFGEDLSYNDKLLQQKQELIDAYQDAVKGAEDEKQAIIDLINQAYDQQLAYINKLIDAKKEQLDVDKDLYEYSKNVQDQTDNIGKLQKQLAAIANDNSEEAMARRQKLQSELNEAQKQLDDTQYDRWYSDQQNMLDKLSKEYGEMIDEVKKNTDANFLQIQEYLDNNLGQVNDALEQVTDKVGYEIQENAFATIWGSSSTVSDVLGGVQSTLSSILEFNEKMYSAATNIGDWFTRWLGMESTVSDETSADTLVNSFYQAFLERNAEEAGYLDWYNQLRNGASVLDIVKGFMYSEEYMGMNKSDAEKIQDLYQSLFGRNGSTEEIAFWLEKIVRDGLSWDDVISGFVNSQEFAQSAIWKRLMDDSLGISGGYEGGWLDWMNDNSVVNDDDFRDYINEKLKGGGLVVHPIEDWGGLESVTYAQNIGSISFELPNVTDYASFVKQAQNDPKFEKMIQSMTINQLSGASALSKYKY